MTTDEQIDQDLMQFELVQALKCAASIIGHPDDAISKYFAEIIAKYDTQE